MLNIVFPRTVTNSYKGHKIVKWFLILLVLKSFVSGSIHMFAPDGGAQTIASIALDEFSHQASGTVITIFALWGMEQFIIGLVGLVVLIRYQSLIPMMWAIYTIEYVMRKLLHFITPGVYSLHTPPGALADNVLVPLCILMFIIATTSSKKRS